MRLSLVARVTTLAAVVILGIAIAMLAILHRSTSTAYVAERSEHYEPGATDAAQRERLTEIVAREYMAGGVDALKALAASPEQYAIPAHAAFLVISSDLKILATTEAVFGAGKVSRDNAGNLLIAAGDQDDEIEIAAAGPAVLPMGKDIGYLVQLPAPVDPKEGDRFATSVWREAALWIAAALAAAIGITVFLMRGTLAPIGRLTAASRRLQQGDIPEPVSRDGSPELLHLIDAFNAALDALAKTQRLRRQLVSDVAHELRTPVTNLKGQLEALGAGLIQADAQFLSTMTTEAETLERLAEDFQQLAVADAGQLRLNLRTVRVAALLDDVVRPLARQFGATWDLEAPEDVGIRVDEARLRQVFVNLFENAARHCRAGAHIDVAVRANANRVTLRVADNGPGVAPEDQPHIFERFYRAEKSRNRATGGSGLGLTISRGLVRAMDGEMRYVDKPDCGAVFEIDLPRFDLPAIAGD